MAVDIGRNIPSFLPDEKVEQEGLYSGDYVDVAVVGAPIPTPVSQLKSISVTPPNASIEVGENKKYEATGTYSDESTKDLTTTATWASLDTNVASIDATGMATGVSVGKGIIGAITHVAVSNPAFLNVMDTAPLLTSPWVTINEILLEPQQDWNDSSGGDGIPFNNIPGNGTVDSHDQWIEIINLGGTIDITGWTVSFVDSGGNSVMKPLGSGILNPGDFLIKGDPGDMALDTREFCIKT